MSQERIEELEAENAYLKSIIEGKLDLEMLKEFKEFMETHDYGLSREKAIDMMVTFINALEAK